MGSRAPIIVHHLNYSRSTRVLWLLEEMGFPYEVVRHERLPGFRGPDALRRIHPAGKAPVIVDGGLVIAESGVILDYLDETYGRHRFTPSDSKLRWRHAEWVAFAESVAGPALMTCLYGRLTGGFGGTFLAMVERDASAALSQIEGAMGSGYLLGQTLTIADIQLSYILELAGYLDRLVEYPESKSYLDRLNDRPALKRAIEAGGPMVPPAS